MNTWIVVVAGIAVLLALPASGSALLVAWTTWQAPADGGRIIAGIALFLAVLDLGSAGLAGWRAYQASGGLVPALLSLGLSSVMLWMAASVVSRRASP